MADFEVTIRYYAENTYLVEARTPEAAESAAEEMFRDEVPSTIMSIEEIDVVPAE